MAEHILVSVVLSSNIPDFQEAVCFIEPQPAEVVEKMIQHLECLQQEASHLMREQLSQTISLLDKLVNEVECNDIADEGHKKMRKTYRRLKEDVDLYSAKTNLQNWKRGRSRILPDSSEGCQTSRRDPLQNDRTQTFLDILPVSGSREDVHSR
jgi:hypothetical protein